ncbi:MAG: hypothetical protein KJO43_12405, partial [Phycisphaerae bacterium]|nr:hypothetical protein [Phycisphaerae bacterium]
MSDRSFLAILLTATGLMLVVLIWTAIALTGGPRSAHEPEIESISNVQLEDIVHRLDDLAMRVGAPATGGAAGLSRSPAQPAPGEVLVVFVDEPLPPPATDSTWDRAPVTVVPLQRQDQAMPMLETVTVPEVRVRALTNGRQIAWRVDWDDPVADYHLDTDLFCDAVALQFPLKANANYKMGDRDFPVQIIQWKAIWQKDID